MVKPYLSMAAICLAITGVMLTLRLTLDADEIALVYLFMVFLSAIWWGRGPSLVASVLAFFGLNFLFTIPFTFQVTSIHEAISLAVFVLVAEETSRLTQRLREREVEARQRAWEASTLHALSAAISASGPSEETVQTLPHRIVEALDVPECALYILEANGSLRRRAVATKHPAEVMSEDDAPAQALQAFVTHQPVEEATLSVPMAVGPNVVGVLYVRPPEGTRLPEATGRLLTTFAGQVAVVIGRLQLQREAAEAEALRRTDELKTSLLAAVSHDLRTPLAAIRMNAAALMKLDIQWGAADRLEMLESIDIAATRLSRLVSNLLDLSRLEAGVMQPDKQWYDLREVVATAVDHARAAPGEPRTIEVDLPPDLPLVRLDFTHIEDVILNLVENALRHSPPGTPIQITARRQNGEAVVLVTNEGPPIPPEFAERIFDRFYMLPGSRGATGLGLAICKGLVEAHGGRIWVERPGEPGARFAFLLPLEEAPPEVGDQPPKARP